MKTFPSVGGVVVFSVALLVAGCGKKEPATTSAPASATAPTTAAPSANDVKSATATAETAAKETVAKSVEQAKAAIADVKVPDLKEASSSELVSSSAETLTNLATVAGTSDPEVAKQVEAVKTSMSSNKAVDALAQIKQLAASAKAIPGADQAVLAAKQMVSAWALKQGFDTAKISPLLGSLQSGDMAGIGSQISTLLGGGSLTDQQKSLLNGVLETYGINSKASELMGKLKLP